MNLTREEAIRLFREHWQWLAETGSGDKMVFLKEKGHEDILNECYLCEYCNDVIYCDECPIAWPHLLTGEPTICGNSYYRPWLVSEDVEARKQLARIISELPPRILWWRHRLDRKNY